MLWPRPARDPAKWVGGGGRGAIYLGPSLAYLGPLQNLDSNTRSCSHLLYLLSPPPANSIRCRVPAGP